jgi:hypothetical protein
MSTQDKKNPIVDGFEGERPGAAHIASLAGTGESER